MKTCDLISEHRKVTVGFNVDVNMTEEFIALYKRDPIKERKKLLQDSLYELLNWYNYKGSLSGKIKLNDDSKDCYHYHFGYPNYTISLNGNYYTSDWFVLFKLSFDYDRDLFVFEPYDYDHHNRRGSWNT